MASPNIVCEGRGRFKWQTHYTREHISNINTSDRTVLDQNKTGVRVSMIPSVTADETLEVMIFNDMAEDDMEVEVYFTKLLSSGVTAKVYDGISEKESGFSVTISPLSYHQLRVVFTITSSASPCSVSSVIFYVNSNNGKTDEDVNEQDACCASLVTQGCTYTDVERQFEMMLKDKASFPTSTYTTLSIVNDYIKSATEEAMSFIHTLWRNSIGCSQLIKQYIIYKVMVNVLLRLSSTSISGSSTWEPTIRLLRTELEILEGRMLNYN